MMVAESQKKEEEEEEREVIWEWPPPAVMFSWECESNHNTIHTSHWSHSNILPLPPSPLPPSALIFPHPTISTLCKSQKVITNLNYSSEKVSVRGFFSVESIEMCKIHYNDLRALVIFNLFFAERTEKIPPVRGHVAQLWHSVGSQIHHGEVNCYYGGLQHYCTRLYWDD